MWLRLIVLAVLALAHPLGALASERLALVIGNGAYRLAPLANPGALRGEVALIASGSMPEPPAEPRRERVARDYNLIGTNETWDASLWQHTKGFDADFAPAALRMMEEKVAAPPRRPDEKHLSTLPSAQPEPTRDDSAPLPPEMRELRSLKGHQYWVTSVAFSPDGRLALTGSYDRTARLWEVNSGREVRQFKGHRDAVSSVAFSPDGRTALTGSDDRTAWLWEVSSGRQLRRLEGHRDWVRSVAFSPDGRLALTGSYDRTARLWEVSSGRELGRLQGHDDEVRSVAFSSPDGRLALTGSRDNTARLWEISTGEATEVGQPAVRTLCDFFVQADADSKSVLDMELKPAIQACSEAVAKYPGERRFRELQLAVTEQRAYQRAVRSKDLDLARFYLWLYPNGRFASEIRSFLDDRGRVAVNRALESTAALSADVHLTEEPTTFKIKIGKKTFKLEGLIVRPAKASGLLPVALITHGTVRPGQRARDVKIEVLAPVARELAHRGWIAVAVLRRGYGKSEGKHNLRSSCRHLDFFQILNNDTEELFQVIRVVHDRPDTDTARVLAIGQSMGGSISLALADWLPENVVAAVNVSGGFRTEEHKGCVHWTSRFTNTYSRMGKDIRAPTLWLYSENDSLFSPKLVRRVHASFTKQGGKADLKMIEPVGTDGHQLWAYRHKWLPELDAFLRKHSLPTWNSDVREAAIARIGPSSTEFVDAYLRLPAEKSIAVSKSRRRASVGWGETIEKARQSSVERCEKEASEPCSVVMENFRLLPPHQAESAGLAGAR